MEHPKSTSSEIECRITNFQIHQQEIEETNLRDSIITHLSNLYKIYAKYASIATSQVLRFKSIMIRYFLWQMFRDKNIVNAKYNLVELDLILIQNPASGFEDDHDPFEKIYFWQFLQILVTLSWTLHKETDVTNSCKQSGVLSTLFVDFLTNVLYNNPGITFCNSSAFGIGKSLKSFNFQPLPSSNTEICSQLTAFINCIKLYPNRSRLEDS